MPQILWHLRLCLLILSLLGIVGVAKAEESGTCYTPTGSVAEHYMPCDETGYIRSCCPSGWTCFSNNICVVTDPRSANSTDPLGSTVRTACTDPSWNNDTCGDFCLPDILGSLTSCGNDTYCCNSTIASGKCNCSTLAGAFHLPSGTVQIALAFTDAPTAAPPITTTSSTASAIQAASPTPNRGLSTGASAGIGVGVSAFILASLGVFCASCSWRHARRRAGDPSGVVIDPGPGKISLDGPRMTQNRFLELAAEVRYANPQIISLSGAPYLVPDGLPPWSNISPTEGPGDDISRSGRSISELSGPDPYRFSAPTQASVLHA